jgi:murein DD-endopeptidase MepM/ murein hydrolase activator NlpD
MKLLLLTSIVCLPLKSLRTTSPFGYRIHPVTGKYAFHAGVDLKAKHDTVFAIMDGMVKTMGYNKLLGIYVCLDHGCCQSLYGHLSQLLVNQADSVQAGDPIAITGATGRVTGEHLHFSISCGGHPIDPLKFLYQILNQKEDE